MRGDRHPVTAFVHRGDTERARDSAPFYIARSEDRTYIFWLCYGSYTGKRDIRLFFNYVQANLHEKTQAEAYRVYMSEAVKNINEILANNFNGSYMKISYTDMMKPQKVEERTAEEIIDDIRSGLQRLQ